MWLCFRKDKRFYHVYLQNNLFGGTTVICLWGVFDNNRGGHKYIFCDNQKQVTGALQNITKTRIARGYTSFKTI